MAGSCIHTHTHIYIYILFVMIMCTQINYYWFPNTVQRVRRIHCCFAFYYIQFHNGRNRNCRLCNWKDAQNSKRKNQRNLLPLHDYVFQTKRLRCLLYQTSPIACGGEELIYFHMSWSQREMSEFRNSHEMGFQVYISNTRIDYFLGHHRVIVPQTLLCLSLLWKNW